jgi:hypothetical protein
LVSEGIFIQDKLGDVGERDKFAYLFDAFHVELKADCVEATLLDGLGQFAHVSFLLLMGEGGAEFG